MVKRDENLSDTFAVNWEVWASNILSYAKAANKSGTRVYCDILSKSSVSSGTYILL